MTVFKNTTEFRNTGTIIDFGECVSIDCSNLPTTLKHRK